MDMIFGLAFVQNVLYWYQLGLMFDYWSLFVLIWPILTQIWYPFASIRFWLFDLLFSIVDDTYLDQARSKVTAKETERGGRAAEMSALSIQCCDWPTWRHCRQVGQSQHWIERADISATDTFPPLVISLAGSFDQSGSTSMNNTWTCHLASGVLVTVTWLVE